MLSKDRLKQTSEEKLTMLVGRSFCDETEMKANMMSVWATSKLFQNTTNITISTNEKQENNLTD